MQVFFPMAGCRKGFRFRWRIVCVATIMFTSMLLDTSVSIAENVKPVFREKATRLAKIPEGAIGIGESVEIRPDAGNVAFVYRTDQGVRACMNEVCGPVVDNVARGMPVISPDGQYWAAVVQMGEKAHVMLNGQVGQGYDIVRSLRFSPDSLKLAYIARQGDEFFVRVNQEAHAAYKGIDHRTGILFSEDSRHLAYVAFTGESVHLVRNGEPGPAFSEIKHVTFSFVSSRLVYAARRENAWHLVEGDDIGPGHRDIMRIKFCPFTGELAYITRKEKGSVIVRNGRESALFDHIIGELVFSVGGDRFAFAVAEKRRRNVRMRAVVDNKPGPPYDAIGAYLFSQDGKHFAYMTEKNGKGRIVHNGREHDAYDSVGVPVFDPTGKNLAYMALREGKWHISKNGKLGPGFDMIQNPVFCHEGKRMAYLARDGERYLVIEDGEVLGEYQWAAYLGFSPGGSLVYAAARDGESFFVVDGNAGNERFYTFVRGVSPVFVEDDILQGIALRDEGREFFLIRAIIGGEH